MWWRILCTTRTLLRGHGSLFWMPFLKRFWIPARTPHQKVIFKLSLFSVERLGIGLVYVLQLQPVANVKCAPSTLSCFLFPFVQF
jgi:hypothetical protein